MVKRQRTRTTYHTILAVEARTASARRPKWQKPQQPSQIMPGKQPAMEAAYIEGDVVCVKTGHGNWPACVRKPSEGGPNVQQQRGTNTVLLRSFGDHMYVWSTPGSISPFEVSPRRRENNKLLATAYQEAMEAFGAGLVGRRVEVFWGGDGVWYAGRVAAFHRQTGRHSIVYDDGDRRLHHLPDERWRAEEMTAQSDKEILLDRHTPSYSPPPALPPSTPPSAPPPSTLPPSTPPAALRPSVPPLLASKSAYEIQRENTIRCNQEMLRSLGLLGPTMVQEATARSPEEEAAAVAARKAKALERAAQLVDAQANKRLSSRLAAKPRPALAESAIAMQRAEATLAWERPEVPQRSHRLSCSHGRKGRKSSVKELTPEQRATLVEAEGWLSQMEVWFSNQLSEPNLRNVMKVVGHLASGRGVVHPLSGALFREGEPIDMQTDFVALRKEANEFLRPEDDAGHGWRLDHPIGKLILFQRHVYDREAN
mmetsp:Transcript_11539/g.19397  ORF Transcript_11539/g.19397 Transcript_11539/m.19397 type:complete len:483 (+) Transcript_11539:13-1461(+)|eukprot:CAMPEP_0119320562 /NCGR_PEP_ID=MMETSP1333-20130426/52776_1 /TAXON_ID=418940 /ORGANISM="Scyphosphaera apsteinii, Strain RCC1455" /LENGTH=482 /DNA_ID=CAMNT_0007327313 /DNA_START=9 /DNA_END=1457 /DNA_ORIENTATION=+